MTVVLQSCLNCRRAGDRWLPTRPPTCPSCHGVVCSPGRQEETLGEMAYTYRREILIQEIKELEKQAQRFMQELANEDITQNNDDNKS